MRRGRRGRIKRRSGLHKRPRRHTKRIRKYGSSRGGIRL